MSGFKDMVAADNEKVFLNLDEFAEEHDLNGTTCKCILQDVSVTENKGIDDDLNPNYHGVYGSRTLVNCKADDLPEIPVTDQAFYVDGKLYVVESCNADMGMLTIQLVGNER